MLSFLGPKGLRAEVTEGIDLEHGVTLTGQRITVGSGPRDDLRLGAGDIVPAHLTFQRRADGRGWEYFTSDGGHTQVDRGNPRTGTVRPGMWFRLGAETRVDIQRTAVAAEEPAAAKSDGRKTVPLTVALPAMAAMAVAAVFAVAAFGSKGSGGLTMRTLPWVTGAADLSEDLRRCIEGSSMPGRAVASTDPASPYWRLMAARGVDPAEETRARSDLARKVNEIMAEAYFLAGEDRDLDASRALRRLEYVLPVGDAPCPILAASRFDVALLELRGKK